MTAVVRERGESSIPVLPTIRGTSFCGVIISSLKYRVFKKELYSGIPNVTVRRVFNTLLFNND
jgi:hypothetical protein